LDLIQILLQADGAAALKRFDYIDRTPLMCAVYGKHLEAARELIRAGSGVDAHNEKNSGNTALHIAAGDGNVEMVRLLLEAGADPMIQGWMQLTPAQKAAGPRRETILRMLGSARQRCNRSEKGRGA